MAKTRKKKKFGYVRPAGFGHPPMKGNRVFRSEKQKANSRKGRKPPIDEGW